MLFLLTYDIEDNDKGKRLRKVAQTCESYGTRVQDSVFELNIDVSKMKELECKLKQVMDVKRDSVRIYKLGKYTKYDVTVIGRKENVEITEKGGILF